jgi:hypothetical protein
MSSTRTCNGEYYVSMIGVRKEREKNGLVLYNHIVQW